MNSYDYKYGSLNAIEDLIIMSTATKIQIINLSYLDLTQNTLYKSDSIFPLDIVLFFQAHGFQFIAK